MKHAIFIIEPVSNGKLGTHRDKNVFISQMCVILSRAHNAYKCWPWATLSNQCYKLQFLKTAINHMWMQSIYCVFHLCFSMLQRWNYIEAQQIREKLIWLMKIIRISFSFQCGHMWMWHRYRWRPLFNADDGCSLHFRRRLSLTFFLHRTVTWIDNIFLFCFVLFCVHFKLRESNRKYNLSQSIVRECVSFISNHKSM